MKPSIFTYIIAAAMLIFGFYMVPQAWGQMMIHSGTSDSVLGNSGLNATFIDNVLCSNGSPACHTGQLLIDESWRHDTAPDYLMAFMWRGSNFGKVNCGQPSALCISYHGSWKDTYDTWCSTIDGPLYKGSGVVSVDGIVSKAGGSPAYAKNVKAAVKLWASGTVGIPT